MRKRKKPHSLFEYLKRAFRKFRKAINRTRPSRGMKEKAMNMAVYFSSLWPRRDSASSQSFITCKRGALAAVVVAIIIVLLTACGGGGGGGTTTPTTPPVVVTPPLTPPVTPPVTPPTEPPVTPPVTPPPVAVEKPLITILSVRPTGTVEITSPITVDVKIERADSASLALTATCNGTAVALSVPVLPVSGGQVSAMPVSGTLPDGSTCDVDVKVTAANTGGSAPEATGETTFTTPPKIYYYTRVNIVRNGEVISDTGNGTLAVGYPQILFGTTVTPLKNETGFQVGVCALSSSKLPNGLPAAWCTKPSNGNVRAWFPIDPTRGVLMPEYVGDVSGMTYYAAPYGTFGDSPYVANGVSQFGMFIDVPGVGTYYYPDIDDTQLRLTRDGFATSELIKSGPHNILLMTYSNPAPNAN